MDGFGSIAGSAFELQVVNCPSQDLAKTNCIFVGPQDPAAGANYLNLGDYIFTVRPEATLATGTVGLNAAQRRIVKVSSGDKIIATVFEPPHHGFQIGVVTADIDYVSKKAARGPEVEIEASALSTHFLSRFTSQIFTVNQEVAFEFQGTNYQLTVNNIVSADVGADNQLSVHQGLLMPDSAFIFETRHGSGIKITGQKSVVATQLFKHKEFNFEKLGIGGLDAQFEQIFRRAFASRIFPPAMVERLGIHHVKGVLLYGPPGTGKTLIARQIGKMLNGKEPKIVNGPEVLNKYVGASEENIRNLFKEAEAEYQRMGDASDLHVIIFDEIDAICKQRGSVQSSAGVHDTVVNQLLTKIDGVDALNNILLIGMTNRKDLLDDALLRPGRLEVQVEIGLPDERGRLQILQIHTNKMSENSFLARDVDLYDLSQRTKNFSGAEIEGLVKSATSFALNRQVDVNDLSKPIDEDNIKVTMEDFLAALKEVTPAFGATIETLDSYRLHGMVDFGPRHEHLLFSCRTLVRQVQASDATPLVTVLLEGPPGTGKTALAATVAIESGFPFVKVVSAEAMVGFSEAAKCQHIAKIFDDAYKSPQSVIVLDEIERLLDYVAIGPRFSNSVLQTLLVLLKKAPPSGRRLFVIGTTSQGGVMEEMEVAQTFNVVMHVASLDKKEMKAVLSQLGAFSGGDLEVAVSELRDGTPIKRLLLLLDLARQGQSEEETQVDVRTWTRVIQDLSLSG